MQDLRKGEFEHSINDSRSSHCSVGYGDFRTFTDLRRREFEHSINDSRSSHCSVGDGDIPTFTGSRASPRVGSTVNSGFDVSDIDEESTINTNVTLSSSVTVRISHVTATIYPCKRLGQQGNVFEGEIEGLVKRPCAIKITPDNKEAEILSKFSFHNHIVGLLVSGIVESAETAAIGPMCIALEKCDEFDLQHHIVQQREHYDVSKGVDYCRQLIRGMKYVHQKLIIHKDLKPSNVLLTHNRSKVKIADFGISEEIRSSTSMVYCGNYGTRGYRPPESFGNSVASLKSDTFSLGSLFYFLLSNGKSPFGLHVDLWDHNTLNGVIDLSQLLSPNPTATSHLIKLMLSLDRRHRPSMEQIEYHPSWNGQECECNFDYGFQQEYDNVASEPKEVGDNDIAANDEEIADMDKWWRWVLEHLPSAFDANSQSKANSQVDSNSEDTKDHFVSTCKTFKTIGPEGGCIEVAGCSVEFQPGTFERERKITVTAEVDSSKWPDGDNVISPIFDVDVGQINIPAKVRLPTWIVPEEKYVVEIMHYSKDLKSCSKIATCHFKDRNFVEFECSNFSGFFAKLYALFWGEVEFSILPSLYIYDKHFIAAVHLDDECIRKSFNERLDNTFHKKSTMSKYSMTKEVKIDEAFDIGVTNESPLADFEFKPKGMYECKIDENIRKGKPFHKQFIIRSQSEKVQQIEIYFQNGSEDPDAILYTWRPDQETHEEGTPSDEDVESCSSARPVVVNNNITVQDDHSKSETVGLKNVRGTVNKTTHDSPSYITGTSKNK